MDKIIAHVVPLRPPTELPEPPQQPGPRGGLERRLYWTRMQQLRAERQRLDDTG